MFASASFSCSLCVCVSVLWFQIDFSLASIVNAGFRCPEDSGSGRAHVQFCQGELIHEVRQLKDTSIQFG